MEVLQLERIANHPAVIPGHLVNAGEAVQSLDRRIVVELVDCPEPHVQLVEELPVDAGERQVGHMEFFVEEAADSVAQHLVSEEGFLAVALGLEQRFVFVDEAVAQIHYGHAPFIVKAHRIVLELVRVEDFSFVNGVIVLPAEAVFELFESLVEFLVGLGDADGLVLFREPAFREDLELCGDMAHLAVKSDTSEDRGSTVLLEFSLLDHIDQREGSISLLFDWIF